MAARSETLEGRFVDSVVGEFVVRGYQRGYRWSTVEVRRLLDDIKESEGSTYYLQPIVVKAMGDDKWELIDGQQRLTTLYLIVRYISHSGLVPHAVCRYTLEFETRPQSAEYLLDPTPEGSGDNIDFFHIHEAWRCISEWFDDQPNRPTAAFKLYQALAERVKVIWFQAPMASDSTALFTRLNVGRIPLTDAELVKALVLSTSRDNPTRPDRSRSMAAEWDSIERDLWIEELWAFLTRQSTGHATHIGLLLDALAGGPKGRSRPQFYTFEQLKERIAGDPDSFWDEVVDLHSRVIGWFEDRTLFHKIGYLIATGATFEHVKALSDGLGRSAFEAVLDARISDHLGLSVEGLRDLSYEQPRDRAKLADVLLLANVESVRHLRHSSERYSFAAHASGVWSLEHIHAQNAEELRTVDQWTSWLQQHRDALATLLDLPATDRQALASRISDALPTINEATFLDLEAEISAVFTPSDDASFQDDVHSISNLALLDGKDNSALKNSVFEVKRLAILERDREGSYIPICTRNVFLKYYTGQRAQQVHYWSAQDRQAYRSEIERLVAPYLVDGQEETG